MITPIVFRAHTSAIRNKNRHLRLPKNSGAVLLATVPNIQHDFTDNNNIDDWHIDIEDAAVLIEGPREPNFKEVWDRVFKTAYYDDPNGNRWVLFIKKKTGDLYAICPELLTDDDKKFLGIKEASLSKASEILAKLGEDQPQYRSSRIWQPR